MKNQFILGIETSCDETAVAIVKNGTEIISNVIASQIDSHKRFGGVVPEVASRHHVENITIVIEEAFESAGITWEDIDAIAVTQGPGLIGALLIGVNAAKALAFVKNKPLIAVHHIAGHIYANRLTAEFNFPILALIVSGGHTELVLMKEHGTFELLGETLDDAAGEAYDKVARILDLPYPGGPEIDRLAKQGTATIDFPRAMLKEDHYDFSFSGLKSAVINYVHNCKQKDIAVDKQDIAASFQASVVDVLVEKTYRAAKEYDVSQLLIAGGVAANTGLRHGIKTRFKDSDIPVLIPSTALCTDNAAMIAAAASIQYSKGDFASLDLNGHPSLLLT